MPEKTRTEIEDTGVVGSALVEKEIRALHDEMTPHVVRARIKQSAWNRMLKGANHPTFASFLLRKLKELKDGPWQDIETTWTLPHLNEQMWESYEMNLGGTVLPEQQRLRRNQAALRKWWHAFQEEFRGVVSTQTKKARAAGKSRKKDSGCPNTTS